MLFDIGPEGVASSGICGEGEGAGVDVLDGYFVGVLEVEEVVNEICALDFSEGG